ncbi:hypothetical protein IAU60_002731 [Kwoniella sp. DSM 27419]
MMARPSLLWLGYNSFRLTSVVFMIWALAVQFLAIANEISIYSGAYDDSAVHAVSTSPSTTAVVSISASLAGTAGTRGPSAVSTLNIGDTASTIGVVASATPVMGAARLSRTADSEEEDRDGEATAPGQPSHLPRKVQRVIERADASVSDAEVDCAVTSVPSHPAGAIFMVISRLIGAATSALLTCGQLGLPEQLLYDYIPWLGPQSTPLWLGLVQCIFATENLRVYATQSVLLPIWGVLVLGISNMILGIALSWRSRKLPKAPPPLLYFHRPLRLLYWTPAPRCYDQLLLQDDRCDDESTAIEKAEKGEPSLPKTQSMAQGQYDVTYSAPEVHQREHRISPEHQSGHTDVRHGGYPTFSGGGLTDPESQVPAGFLERGEDGRPMRFVRAEGPESHLPAVSQLPTRSALVQSPHRPPVRSRHTFGVGQHPPVQSLEQQSSAPAESQQRNSQLRVPQLTREESADTIALIKRGRPSRSQGTDRAGDQAQQSNSPSRNSQSITTRRFSGIDSQSTRQLAESFPVPPRGKTVLTRPEKARKRRSKASRISVLSPTLEVAEPPTPSTAREARFPRGLPGGPVSPKRSNSGRKRENAARLGVSSPTAPPTTARARQADFEREQPPGQDARLISAEPPCSNEIKAITAKLPRRADKVLGGGYLEGGTEL